MASRRFIFIGLGLYDDAVLPWLMLRLPETHALEKRRALSLAKIKEAVTTTLSIRLSISNTVALMLVHGALFAFINLIQQIVFDVFGQPNTFANLGSV